MKHLSETFNRDCVEAMKEYPDNYFDLAVVDPPYGISINMNMGRKKNQAKKHKEKDWDDSIPSDEYFEQLRRISLNQIVWGGNYFPYIWDKGCRHFIFWDKETPLGMSFSDGELAWTSFDMAIRKYQFRNTTGYKIHPTQKPVALYEWIFNNYAKPNDKILDTHLGSQSSRIAAYKAGLDFTGFELDKEYFEQGNKRFNDFLTVYEQEVGKEKILNGQSRLF
jgi:site-specific DNA-methyltransferase (adenine-specific)